VSLFGVPKGDLIVNSSLSTTALPENWPASNATKNAGLPVTKPRASLKPLRLTTPPHPLGKAKHPPALARMQAPHSANVPTAAKSATSKPIKSCAPSASTCLPLYLNSVETYSLHTYPNTTSARIYKSLANKWGRVLRRCLIYRLCPMLNGTIKQDEGFGDSAFGSIAATPSQMSAMSPGFGT